jgi:hypothetical protein
MVPTESEADKARGIADRVVRHALADAHFREELKANPKAVLEKAGLSAAAAEDVAREMEIDRARHPIKCDETCWVTCIFTCYWTDKS